MCVVRTFNFRKHWHLHFFPIFLVLAGTKPNKCSGFSYLITGENGMCLKQQSMTIISFQERVDEISFHRRLAV